MSLQADELRDLQVLCRQYLQLVDANSLKWPESTLLKKPDVQEWLFEHMFDQDSIQYLPPARYQARVLKNLTSRIEAAIEDPEEDVCHFLSPSSCGANFPFFSTWVWSTTIRGNPAFESHAFCMVRNGT